MTINCAVLVASLMLLPYPVLADDHPTDRLSVAVFSAGLASISLSAADAIITYRAVTDGRAREANPLLVPFVRAHGIGPVMVGKFGVDVGQELGLRYIAKTWPERRKTVLIARIAAIAVKSYVVSHNVHVLRGGR